MIVNIQRTPVLEIKRDARHSASRKVVTPVALEEVLK